MNTTIQIIQLVSGLLLIFLTVIQQREGGLGSAFGGSSGGLYTTRRGFEKTLFYLTIILAIIFVICSILIFVI
ncbi:MAG: preprotein translocase subunit SecG [Candidatus Pacebacteria bacterium]|nr:preprotein translocase subunit SecG [Candidatus Paceibacterota bacterium]